MARLGYIVSAYKLPAQLERLLRRLSAPGAMFVVHVDRRTSRSVYEETVARTRDLDVVFLPRHRSPWGGFGHVRTSLKGIAQLIESDVAFDYAVLLTGQDYPLRSPQAIASFLGAGCGRSYMNHWTLPYPPWDGRGGLDRVERWHLITSGRLHLSLPLHRRIPLGLEPYGGGAYWCLARPLVDFVYHFARENPAFVRFFEHVFIPDELFFQTVIMNSRHGKTVVNDNLRYLDWSRDPGPSILTSADLPALRESPKLFARKFDETVDSSILDTLDDLIDTDEGRRVG